MAVLLLSLPWLFQPAAHRKAQGRAPRLMGQQHGVSPPEEPPEKRSGLGALAAPLSAFKDDKQTQGAPLAFQEAIPKTLTPSIPLSLSNGEGEKESGGHPQTPERGGFAPSSLPRKRV